MPTLIEFAVFVGRPILGLAVFYLAARLLFVAYFITKQQFKGTRK